MIIIGLTLLFGVAAAALLVRWIEPRLAFFPTAGETETPADYGVPFEPITIATGAGDQLHAWIMRVSNPRANVVYFHGNGGNLSNWAPILTGIVQHGYSVFAFDYRGYGLSTGHPTERGLYDDAGAILDCAWSGGIGGVPTIYWGRSLGGAIAAYAATIRPPHGIILESAFPDARAAVRDSTSLVILSLLATYRFPTADLANRARCPVLVLHGNGDRVIPFALGQELFDRLTVPKQFVVLEGGDHNDVVPPRAEVYWSAVGGFAASLRR